MRTCYLTMDFCSNIIIFEALIIFKVKCIIIFKYVDNIMFLTFLYYIAIIKIKKTLYSTKKIVKATKILD